MALKKEHKIFVDEMVMHGDHNDFIVSSFTDKKPKGFYVYTLINPITEKVFYIGKGKNNRCYRHQSETTLSTINREKFNEIQKIKAKGFLPIVCFYPQDLTENEAYALERELISILKYQLTNIANGQSGLCTGLLNSTLKMIHLLKINRTLRGKNTLLPRACAVLNIWRQNG